MSQVKECMKVTIEYTLRTTTPDGETTELPPETCSFIYGIDTQYPSVESALMNKKACRVTDRPSCTRYP